jgi:pimeloyl-ACP methyl ester carboxylesterase
MRITSTKSRFLAVLSSAALVAAVVVSGPAHAASTDPVCDGKAPVQTCTGTTSDGALYEMRIPADYTGTAMIWSHGFGTNAAVPAGVLPIFPNGVPVDPRPNLSPANSEALNAYVLSKGVALMGSGFSTQAWNLDEAVKTNTELIGIFKAKFPTTSKVVAWGYSMGGGITQAFAEQHPELISAAAVINPVDGSDAMLKYLGDTLWLFKTFFDPTIKAGNYSAGKAGDMEMVADIGKVLTVLGSLQSSVSTGAWPATSSATGKALEAAGVPSRSALLLIGLLTGQSTQSKTFDSISGPDGALKLTFPLAVSPALAVLENTATALSYGLFFARDIDQKFGGLVFDNTTTDYTAMLSEDDRDIYNAALSGNTAVNAMLGALNPANPGAPRQAGTPAAMAKYKAQYNITGKITVPTVMVIGLHDPLEPAGIVQRIQDKYNVQFAAEKAAAMAAARKSRSYVAPVNKLNVIWSTSPASWTKFTAAGLPYAIGNTPGTGHTNFSPAHYKLVIDSVLQASATGKLPSGGPWATAVRKAKDLKIDKFSSFPYMKYYQQ